MYVAGGGGDSEGSRIPLQGGPRIYRRSQALRHKPTRRPHIRFSCSSAWLFITGPSPDATSRIPPCSLPSLPKLVLLFALLSLFLNRPSSLEYNLPLYSSWPRKDSPIPMSSPSPGAYSSTDTGAVIKPIDPSRVLISSIPPSLLPTDMSSQRAIVSALRRLETSRCS